MKSEINILIMTSILDLLVLSMVFYYLFYLYFKKIGIFSQVYIGHSYAVKAIIFSLCGVSPVISVVLAILWYFSFYVNEYKKM